MVEQYFNKNYPQIDKEVKNILLQEKHLEKNISNKLDFGTGLKQLIRLAEKEGGEDVCLDDICFLDLDNLRLAKKIIKLKKMKCNEDALKRLEKNEKYR